MRWCLLLQGTLLMVFSIAAAQDDTLEIKAFLKKDTSSYAVQFSTTHPNMPDTENIKKYHVIKTVEGSLPEQTESYTSSSPVSRGSEWEVTFTDSVNLAALSTKTVHLVLNGLNMDDVPEIKGDISIANFPATLTIKKIQRILLGFTVTFDLPTTPPTSIEKYQIQIDGASVNKINATSIYNDENSATFMGSLDGLQGETSVNLLLHGLDSMGAPTVFGETTVSNFPAFPTDFAGQLATDPLSQYHLRCMGIQADWELEPTPTGTHVTGNDIHYYLSTAVTDTSFALCLRASGTDTIDICDKVEAMSGVGIVETLTVKEATLQYESNTVKMTVESTDSVSKKVEVMKSLDGSTYDLQAPTTLSDMEISVTGFTPSGTISFIIVGLSDTDVLKEYAIHTFTDYEVQGLGISATSLEVWWNYQDGESKYYLQRSTVLDDTGYTEASITCNPSEDSTIKHCFGYFPGLKAGDYQVTVKKNSDPAVDDLNMVESNPIKVSLQASYELSIQHHLDWERNGMEAQIRVCFNHTRQNTEQDFSHYEFVIINNKNGKWFKHKLMTHDTEVEQCFSPQTISVDMFHHQEGAILVVTQRAEDGFTVVASGEIQLFLNAEQLLHFKMK